MTTNTHIHAGCPLGCAESSAHADYDALARGLAAAGVEFRTIECAGEPMAAHVGVPGGVYTVAVEEYGPVGRYVVAWFLNLPTGARTVEPADDWTLDAAGLDAWAHAVAVAQSGTLPPADVVEAAGLDPSGREYGPVTWTEVAAGLLARVAERAEADR